jgi:cytidylate kinase
LPEYKNQSRGQEFPFIYTKRIKIFFISQRLQKMIITISGFHGSGKTSVAKALVKEFKFRYLAAGDIFRQKAVEYQMILEEFSKFVEQNPEIDREIDDTIVQEAENGNVILDGLLAAWLTRQIPGLHILLTAEEQIRINRIAQRENRVYEEVEKETLTREKSEITRFKKLYKIDIKDYSIYEIVLNTGLWSEKVVSQTIIMLIKEYMKSK